jgi:hypothetical protein
VVRVVVVPDATRAPAAAPMIKQIKAPVNHIQFRRHHPPLSGAPPVVPEGTGGSEGCGGPSPIGTRYPSGSIT